MSIIKKLRPSRTATPELARSQYSLVSCSELSPEAVQIWSDLPDEVKYDSSLALFRKFYEKQSGKLEDVQLRSLNTEKQTKRLPLVNSAPHLNRTTTIASVIPENGLAHYVSVNPDTENNNVKNNGYTVNSESNRKKQSNIAQAKHCIKMTVLVASWLFFTVVFMMYGEKEVVVMKTAVLPEVTKYYELNMHSAKQLSIQIDLSGPFLSEVNEKELTSKEMEAMDKVVVWLEGWSPSGNQTAEKSEPWSIVLDKNDPDFNVGEMRSNVLYLTFTSVVEGNKYAIKMMTNSKNMVPISLSYTKNPLDQKSGVIYACILLVALYVLIIFEIINRALAAVIVATLSLAVLALTGQRPSLDELVSWLDVETLLLLFSMMIIVAIMAETGLFDFLAVFTFQVTRGRTWPLINLLCLITAVLSTFLDNVTTILLMTPVTIKLCEVTNLNPVPVLMAMVMYSNIGGTATPVGDPPNVIIASNKDVIQAGINFANFTLHATLGIVAVCVQTSLQLRYLVYRNAKKLHLALPKEVEELRKQLLIWRRAQESIPQVSKDQAIVWERLEKKVRKMTLQLEELEKSKKPRKIPQETFETTLAELKGKYKIRDKVLLVKALVAIGFVVVVFFLHAFPTFHRVSLGWTALLGAILLLILADREELEPIMHRVEWSTLLFFASLFVLMEALTKLGLIAFIGGLTESLVMSVNENARLAVAILLILWVSGITSAFVDNIPFTTMMIRVVTSLGTNPTVNLPMSPLIWSLVFGACLGGNGTLIGASANVVCAGVAEQHGYKFTFVEFFKVGFPLMIGHLFMTSIYLLICHCVFTWH